MARNRSGFYSTIEFIGPRPIKPKRPNIFGGWVIIVIACGMAFYFGRPLVPFLKAAQVTASTEQADRLISSLENSPEPGDRLAAVALAHAGEEISYDPTYFKMDYPNGDVPATKGVAADVLVRCYRKIGVDLQKEIHEDMSGNFRLYPQLWSSSAPDTNIDHRRVPNLHRFLSRKGTDAGLSREASEYRPGDIVVWALGNAETHIGIVVPGPGDRSGEPWIVHNMGSGVKWENVLFEYPRIGHYRFPAAK